MNYNAGNKTVVGAVKPILILGGTGKTGRRVAERLTERGLPVRIGSRSGEPSFDWENRSTWESSLQNVGAVYITYYPDLAVPGAAAAIGAFAELAVNNGIKRLVLLSGRGEEEAQLSERAVQDSGADWTIVRASWFCQNFSESFLLGSVLSGMVALPAADVAEPFIDAEDIADVVVASLTEDGHIGQLYELTGPRALTFAEATEEIAKASGRHVRYVQLSAEQFTSMLSQQGIPAEFIALLTDLFTKVLDGRNSHLTDGVQRALGRGPRDFADYARDAAASGVWEVHDERPLA
ncbi:NAD(P)H-binding protein [Paenibacillus piri]|uniref:NmrA family transcriptional regulator n=1 Tax=Paenibacillus piri TaxID=2547395 RepID=A0A4R5KI65_9BACL|nr:NAD(P)H-binding protein [Paenibacillus piri]TDF95076.1 NmrA family transcriptional regulator [Paenibacillus piri]